MCNTKMKTSTPAFAQPDKKKKSQATTAIQQNLRDETVSYALSTQPSLQEQEVGGREGTRVTRTGCFKIKQ